MTDQTPSTEDVPQFLTDEEWREFQAIPDQGYSHRHWVNRKIAKYAAAHDRAVKAEAWDEGAASQSRHHTEVYVAECNLSRYPKPPANPYRIDRIEAEDG